MPDGNAEWLEADGLGGFVSGTVSGIRTRRYHALLLAATTPPTGRLVLVNGLEAWIEADGGGPVHLTSQAYVPDVVHPDGAHRIASFTAEPWPRWTFALPDGTVVEQEIFARKGSALVAIRWRVLDRTERGAARILHVRPLLSGRDYHALHHENPVFRFDADRVAGEGWPQCAVAWRPYEGLPTILALANGAYDHAPEWYRGFRYDAERERGLDFVEDLASPGMFRWDLAAEDAVLLLAAEGHVEPGLLDAEGIRRAAAESSPDGSCGDVAPAKRGEHGSVRIEALFERLRAAESERRARFPTRLELSADAYLVRRGSGKTIVAGYPWFTDWGRDTFIALRGLCLATGRLDDARAILLEWSGAVSEGMLPNLFTDAGAAPEYNSVDASLWYVVAVHEYFEAVKRASRAPAVSPSPERGPGGGRSSAPSREARADAPLSRRTGAGAVGSARPSRSEGAGGPGGRPVPASPGSSVLPDREREALVGAVLAIVSGYARGTRFGIRMDDDGLLAAGAAGVQLTWMDAKIGDWVVTPRIGKPVEVQALWLNALRIASHHAGEWELPFRRGWGSFLTRFWNEKRGCLFDVVDIDHRHGTEDPTIRPNQILAVGGLPYPLLDGDHARSIVDVVEARLATPLGLRSLAPGEPGYAPRYAGDPRERDGAYHQGTVWPWLIGPFVEAWVRVRGGDDAMKAEAKRRFLAPLLAHLDQAGLGHVSEIADAEPPFTPRGCPFQAWSVGEAIRLDRVVLAADPPARSRRRSASRG